MKRRDFLKGAALMTAATGAGGVMQAANLVLPAQQEDRPLEDAAPAEEVVDGKLIVSAPMLQNYAATSMGVAFAVSSLANGYVLVGKRPDLSDARKVMCGGYRTTEISDRVIQVRLSTTTGSGPTASITAAATT